MKSRALSGLFLLCAAGTACQQDVPRASWSFRFAEPALASRAVTVETEIREGGCGGRLVFVTRVSPGSEGSSAPRLGKGRYGFHGRARDANCTWFAEGCAEAELPYRGTIGVVLDLSVAPIKDASCVVGDETVDPATVLADGAVQDPGPGIVRDDAGKVVRDDAGRVVLADGGTDKPDGMVVDGFDPSAPKCRNLDAKVVACFDFDGDLADGSPAGNDAVADNTPSFESALSGEALRVGGQRVAVADAASLNPTAFTVEIWFKADDLVNLDGETNDISLLVDKDQQYNVGFTSSGALLMQVYRAVEDSETTTADTPRFAAGQLVYAAFSYDGNRSAIYKDGVQIDAENVGLDLFQGNGGTLHIGSGSPNTTRPFDGLIDALRISNDARAESEICENAGKTWDGASCQ